MASNIDLTKLAAARLWAANKLPYLATGLFAMLLIPSSGLGTFAVDSRWRIYVDPECVASWSVPEIGAVLVHELFHLLRDHASRAKELGLVASHASSWNIAGDAEINDDLIGAELPLPGEPITPGAYGWPESALAETYFHLLLRHLSTVRESTNQRAAVDKECGSGAHGERRDWELDADADGGVDTDDAALLRRNVAAATVAHARGRGRVPAGWLRWAEVTLSPVVDWRLVLGSEIRHALNRASGRVDFTFSRRSRRASATGNVLLPGLYRPAPEIAIVLDTSGSMETDELRAALSEVNGILDRGGLAFRRVPVLACDTEVGAITFATRSSEVKLVGGGGTEMGAGIFAASRLRPRPQVVVVLTDGMTSWPDRAPLGISIVVGLIGPAAVESIKMVPDWARSVVVGAAS